MRSASLRAAPGGGDHGAVEAALAARRCRACRRSTICASPRMATPARGGAWSAPCGETIETLAPTSRFSSVDLPALGAPISATKPQRVAVRPGLRHERSSDIRLAAAACSAARLDLPLACCRALAGDPDLDREGRIVRRAGRFHHLIDGQRQAGRLGPFLQRRLGVLRRAARRRRAAPPSGARRTAAPRRARHRDRWRR